MNANFKLYYRIDRKVRARRSVRVHKQLLEKGNGISSVIYKLQSVMDNFGKR